MRPYYTLPLKTHQLQKKERHSLCDLKEGIAQYLHLILKTHLTEYRYDYAYGCFVWEQDFENIQSVSKWENQLENLIKSAIKDYEKRLDNLLVKIKVEEPKDFVQRGDIPNRLKRRINITVSGMVRRTRELFQHQELIYFSPLTIQ